MKGGSDDLADHRLRNWIIASSTALPGDKSLYFRRRWRRSCCGFLLSGVLLAALAASPAQMQSRSGSHSGGPLDSLSEEERKTVERAIGVVCSERRRDSKGSVPIDDTQRRPSLPLTRPEVMRGAELADRLLPVSKGLVVSAL